MTVVRPGVTMVVDWEFSVKRHSNWQGGTMYDQLGTGGGGGGRVTLSGSA